MDPAAARVKLEPEGLYRRVPLAPHQLRDRVTRTVDAIVLCHLGVAHLDRAAWSLMIDGLVERPATFGFDDLRSFPRVELTSIHQCAGSPLLPFEPTRRICNVTWGGVRLADLLAEVRPMPEARFLWSSGVDGGVFEGVRVDRYLKDLPLERIGPDVLIADAMNGAPLPPEHGYPARLVVPGFYGTNSVKWLTRMTLAATRAEGPFTTRWYNDPVLDAAGRETGASTPVWSIAPESVIVSPAPRDALVLGAPVEVWGWAWADGGVRSVDILDDQDATWRPAALEPPNGRQWQRFSARWIPAQTGTITLASRALAASGELQPQAGRRNAVHRVSVTVG